MNDVRILQEIEINRTDLSQLEAENLVLREKTPPLIP